MTPTASQRLPAAERRDALVDTALRIFSEGSYRGTTTAEIARVAGVSEPILYRHFASKRDLYLACIDESWRRLRAAWEEAIELADSPADWLPSMGGAYVALKERKHLVAELWMQALVEAADDHEVRKFLRRHMRDVHGFVADIISRCQAAGVANPDRDSDAEAWIFIAVGLLGTMGRRMGGLLSEDDFAAIRESRRAWMVNG